MDFESLFEEEVEWDEIELSKQELREWYENNKDVVDKSENIWVNLGVRIISAVGDPAHDSEFVALKSESECLDAQEVDYVVREKSAEKQIAYAAAMVPDELDKEGDIVPSPVVEMAAHKFIENKKNDSVDAEHETPKNMGQSLTDRGTVVESWVLRDSEEFETINGNKKSYDEGTWMVGIKFEDEVWKSIKDGDINGYSIMGVPDYVENKSVSKVIQGENNNSSMTESESDNDSVTVEFSKDELVESITSEIPEPETKEVEVEVEPELNEVLEREFEEKAVDEVERDSVYSFVANVLDVDASEVSEALESVVEGDEDEGEDEEEMNEDETEEESEKDEESESEESEKSETEESEESEAQEKNVDRVGSEENMEGETQEKSETEESESDAIGQMWS